MATRRIGQILVDLGYLTEAQLWDVLEEQKQSPGEVLGQVAVRLELVTDEQVTEALAEQWGMPVVNLRETTIPPKVLELVPQTMAEIYKIVTISLKSDLLTVAMGDPHNVAALDDLCHTAVNPRERVFENRRTGLSRLSFQIRELFRARCREAV